MGMGMGRGAFSGDGLGSTETPSKGAEPPRPTEQAPESHCSRHKNLGHSILLLMVSKQDPSGKGTLCHSIRFLVTASNKRREHLGSGWEWDTGCEPCTQFRAVDWKAWGGWSATGHSVCRELLPMVTPETLGIPLGKKCPLGGDSGSQSVTQQRAGEPGPHLAACCGEALTLGLWACVGSLLPSLSLSYFFETGFYCLAQANLELKILWPPPPQCLQYKCPRLVPVTTLCFQWLLCPDTW